MKQRTGQRLGVALLAAAVAGAFALIASNAMAAGPAVTLSSGTAAPGAQTSLALQAWDIPAPGLGAWSIDISYDPAVVTPVSCETEHGAVCNLHFTDDTIRTAGATAIGFEGDTDLATLTFQCADDEGQSTISVSLPDFADATLGGPQQITTSVTNGSVTCTNTPATATAVPQVPSTGTGGPSDGSDSTLLIALLAGAGVVGIAGFGVLRARTTRK